MRGSSPRSSPSILVVESNAIIGIDLCDYLEDQGYTVAGPFACAGALKWLEINTPDAALLDVDLQSGACVNLAHELRRRAVPLLVFSAHDQRFALREFQDVPWVPLPAPFAAIDNALSDLLYGPLPEMVPQTGSGSTDGITYAPCELDRRGAASLRCSQ